MEPAQRGKSGYLQMHVQSTMAKKSGKLGRGLLETGGLGGMEAYVAHLERQLSKSGAAVGGGGADRLGALEAGRKQMEEKMAQCFEQLQGTQDFGEELARDTHARFEHAQGRTQRCERALKTVYHDMPRSDKLEALVRALVEKESRETDRRLVQLVDLRYKQLEEMFERGDGGSGEVEPEREEGSSQLRGTGRLKGSPKGEKVGERVRRRKQRETRSAGDGSRAANGERRANRRAELFPGTTKLAPEGQLEDELADLERRDTQHYVDCQNERCEQTHRRGMNECCCQHGRREGNGGRELGAAEFEERIRDAVEAALASRLAASDHAETAAQEVEPARAASEEPTVGGADSQGRYRKMSGKANVAGGKNEGVVGDWGAVDRAEVHGEGTEGARSDELEAAVATHRRENANLQSFRVSTAAQAVETERLSRELSEQAASLAKLSGGTQRLTSLEAAVEGVNGSIQRLSSLETFVEKLGGSIQRLPSREDAIGRTTARIEQLVAACGKESGAPTAKQEKNAATLREHAGVLAQLQARVDDVSTLVLNGTRGGHPDVRRSAPPPSGLLARPEVDEKHAVEKRVVGGVGGHISAGQNRIYDNLESLQRSKINGNLGNESPMFQGVTAKEAEDVAGLEGFGQLTRPSLGSDSEDRTPLETSSSRSPRSSPRLRASTTAHVRFGDSFESFEKPLNAKAGMSGRVKQKSESLSEDECFAGSLWAVTQADAPSGSLRPPEIGSSKGASLASIMHRFEADKMLLTEERLQSGAGTGHVDANGGNWGLAGKDEGSAYARALAKTEERKRRLDKVTR
ncbi:hypothetical protein KFL_000140190 [Klebsormidium nitens]|uniref:Uncharacterized protein n=1 Tax=Klebsormidium nitens TaxID=105231 RepID=A0A1Y1HJ07_KLENI|nr:hypothetical protein KFL_000140190 [Klebsormidium nitens]|eukprot:GAQ78500.1 hypothetical protein KFL_000140190 [Klebsormidium nitens]